MAVRGRELSTASVRRAWRHFALIIVELLLAAAVVTSALSGRHTVTVVLAVALALSVIAWAIPMLLGVAIVLGLGRRRAGRPSADDALLESASLDPSLRESIDRLSAQLDEGPLPPSPSLDEYRERWGR